MLPKHKTLLDPDLLDNLIADEFCNKYFFSQFYEATMNGKRSCLITYNKFILSGFRSRYNVGLGDVTSQGDLLKICEKIMRALHKKGYIASYKIDTDPNPPHFSIPTYVTFDVSW